MYQDYWIDKERKIIYNAFLTRLDWSTTPVKPKKFKQKFMDKYGKNLTKPIEAQEYAEILKEVKNNKAPGPHSIKGELIKNGGFTLNSYMRIWINKMLYQGRVPHKLKQGKVKLLYKKLWTHSITQVYSQKNAEVWPIKPDRYYS